MAVGTVAGMAAGIVDGAGIEAMAGAAAGIAGAGAAGGARDTASLRSTIAGGARGAVVAESDARDRKSAARSAALAFHLLQQRLGKLEVRGDGLNVVVVFERPDEAQDLFARLVIDSDGVLRSPDNGGLLGLAELRL
jgi:hypothetical protein